MTVSTDAQEADGGPVHGSYVMDTRREKVGEVIGRDGAFVRLRPPAGGPEWICPAAFLRVTTAREQLVARNALANARSRGEVCR
ncbi:hypothetical protein OG204_16150 [Streptomyces sp. NBC_01387]|uniref:hypothetical protein n=1 Tax=unclassified Streptomyces TaxID=2593676 RepID=UPI00202552BE|nr:MULTISPECIES: hypothetical protein [unclassified Streptomyces]MCX4550096.1 hypothetical protein [Streptomyces sp. NBC_01500]WSC21591.1 hypothetical protein OIE60_18975 [Streptomyces sp. NBC_01766]WSV55554.1 hypothetical protein OG282_18675 [Streptomyces sp. NBC_01014]